MQISKDNFFFRREGEYMFHVAICDDEMELSGELKRTVIDIFTKLKIKPKIDVFHSGEDLCNKIEVGAQYELLFLDIAFAENEINGVEVGRRIRDMYKNELTSIVYISWEKEYSMQLFEIRPINFLLKPLQYDKIEHAVRTHLKISGLSSRVFTYKKGHVVVMVPVKDIVYLENFKRKVIIHFADGRKDDFYGSLKEIYQDQLKHFDFLFTHASFVVNFDYIKTLNYNQLFLLNREEPLQISPGKKDEVRQICSTIIKRRRAAV